MNSKTSLLLATTICRHCKVDSRAADMAVSNRVSQLGYTDPTAWHDAIVRPTYLYAARCIAGFLGSKMI